MFSNSVLFLEWQKQISFTKQEDLNCGKCYFLFFDSKKFTDNGRLVCLEEQKTSIMIPARRCESKAGFFFSKLGG